VPTALLLANLTGMASGVTDRPVGRLRGGPRLRSREPGHRQASWGELFYDLVYVVIVGQIAHTLVEEQTVDAVGRALVLFVIVWWAWANEVLYSTRFDQDTDRARRLLGTAQLIALVLLAAAIARNHSNDFRVIAAAYAIVRTLQVVELWRAGRWVPDARALTEHYTRWHGVAVLLWWVGMPLPTPWCFLLWGAGFAVGVAAVVTGTRYDHEFPPHVAHLPERFGLFVILVLGESFFGLVTGSAALPLTVESTMVVSLAVVMAVAMWWIYFDRLDEEAVRALVEPGMARTRPFIVWFFAHLPLAAGLLAAGAGTELVIHHAESHGEGLSPSAILVGGVALFVLAEAVVCITAVGAGPPELRVTRGVSIRLVAFWLLLPVGAAAVHWSSALLTLALVDVVLVAVVLLDYVFQRRAGLIA
jgi:low temperature requirement protein LtrA